MFLRANHPCSIGRTKLWDTSAAKREVIRRNGEQQSDDRRKGWVVVEDIRLTR